MGLCYGKPSTTPEASNPTSTAPNKKEEEEEGTVEKREKEEENKEAAAVAVAVAEVEKSTTKPWASPFFPFYSPSPARSLFSKKSPSAASAGGGSAAATPRRLFKLPFPPPSPAKHIRAALARRHGSVKPNEAAIAEEGGREGAVAGLDKGFGFAKGFEGKYEVGEEVGRGHFGYTCSARFKKGERKGEQVAVKVIPKAKVQ